MNRLWNTGLAAGLVCCSAAVFAQYHTVYFNQQGKITATMSSVAYVRRYQVDTGMTQVQGSYYPSMKKYSDPCQVSATQIRDLVPVLGNDTLTLQHFSGQKKIVSLYRNNRPHGEWISWYPDGKKSVVMPYANGLSEGTGSCYYRNGIEGNKIQFKNGRTDGYWRQWYADGSPKTEVMMVNDKPTGIVSWNGDGHLLSEITITNGRHNGIVLDRHGDGAKKSEAVYVDDQLVKKTYWDEEGSELD